MIHTSNVWSPKLSDNTVMCLSPLSGFGFIFRATIGNIARALCFKGKHWALTHYQSLTEALGGGAKFSPYHFTGRQLQVRTHPGTQEVDQAPAECAAAMCPSSASSSQICLPNGCLVDHASQSVHQCLSSLQQGEPSIGYSIPFSELCCAPVSETLTEGSPSVS